MASAAVGTNSSSTALIIGTNVVTILDTVGCDTSRRSPRNSWVPFCRRYIHAISTARYNPHAFGRAVFLFHGSVSASWIRRTSSCICDNASPVVRWYRNGSPGIENSLVGTLKFSRENRCLHCDTPKRINDLAKIAQCRTQGF